MTGFEELDTDHVIKGHITQQINLIPNRSAL